MSAYYDSPEQIQSCLNCKFPASTCTGVLTKRCRVDNAPDRKRGRPRGKVYDYLPAVVAGEMSAASLARMTGESPQHISRSIKRLKGDAQPSMEEGT